jgi:5-methylcytosine-specific restriction endonuclease McrA
VTTSRTGTAVYLRNAARVKKAAQRNGLTHCPGFDDAGCGRELDYTTPLTPASAEADHILEVKHGGTDELGNLRVICRSCNGRRNKRTPPPVPAVSEFPTSRIW